MQQLTTAGLRLCLLSDVSEETRSELPALYTRVFAGAGWSNPQSIGVRARDFVQGKHPGASLDDIPCIIDTARNGEIIAILIPISQSWQYGGIRVGVGRTEMVATHPEYQGKGLNRVLMDWVHEHSIQKGHLIQVVSGIPYYYRKFGYTLSVKLGSCAELVLPGANETSRRFQLRKATESDIQQLLDWEPIVAGQGLLVTERNQKEWHYEISQRSADSPYHMTVHLIVDQAGEPVGYVMLRSKGDTLSIDRYFVSERTSVLAVFDDVLAEIGRSFEAHRIIRLATDVPAAVEKMALLSGGRPLKPYAWYVRIPDPVAFLLHIKPLLEKRLEGSIAHQFSGELNLYIYDRRMGLRITFVNGLMTAAQSSPVQFAKASVALSYDDLINVLFGNYELKDIKVHSPDIRATPVGQCLMDTLFPAQRSAIAAIG